MNPFSRKSQESDVYSQDDYRSDGYERSVYSEEPSFDSDFSLEKSQKRESRIIRVGEVQAVFGNSYQPSPEDDQIQNMGFLRKRDHSRMIAEEEKWSERQSPLNFLIILSLCGIVGGGGWFAYQWLSRGYNQPVPVILAESAPYKTRPENPGGMEFPHQDKLVYGRIMPEQNQVHGHHQVPEQLLPPPEQPLDFQSQFEETMAYSHPPQDYPSSAYEASSYPSLPAGQQQPVGSPYYPDHPQGSYPENYRLEHPSQNFTPEMYPQEYEYPAPSGQSYPRQENMLTHPTQPYQSRRGGGSVPREQPYQQQSIHQPSQRYSNSGQPLPRPAYNTPVYPGEKIQDKSEREHVVQETVSKETSIKESSELHQPSMVPTYNQGRETPAVKEKAASAETSILDNFIDEEMSGRALNDSVQENTPSYRIQIATFPNQLDAETEIKRLRHLDPSLFKSAQFIVQKFKNTKTDKILYRVVIGGFADVKSANQFQNKLKVHRISGIISKV